MESAFIKLRTMNWTINSSSTTSIIWILDPLYRSTHLYCRSTYSPFAASAGTMFIKLRCRQLARSSVIKHAGNHYSELLIATKITLFVAGDEIKIALAYNTGSMWHPQGAGRLEYSSTTLPKSCIGCIPLAPPTRLEMEVINAQ